jgi:diguanylate cyclase (GGDEF)-like protein
VAVADLGIAHVGNSAAPVVTISIGVAWRTPGLNDESAELLAEADSLLYQAKNQGRNSVASRLGSTAGDLSAQQDLN